jgi:hypothetical protein
VLQGPHQAHAEALSLDTYVAWSTSLHIACTNPELSVVPEVLLACHPTWVLCL